ncbi:MAG: hypothetical protein KDJ16_03380 [Hyphomicrobiales bacterium]|nr:hypothetical protein [Hyphomicrobiales bacterium]
MWGISISHKTSGGIAHVMKVLSEPKYAHATLYCKAANARAERLFLSIGFTKGAMINGFWRPDLMEYTRPETQIEAANDDRPTETTPPIYDSFNPENVAGGRIGIKLVHTSEELLQVMMIRGAAYLGDQGLPWAEDVDRNDYCGAHLIGYVGNEPAACLRVRFFAGFVKLERLAVMPRFRKTSIAMRIVRAGIEYSRMKGYTRFYGQTELSVFPIWRRFGFVLRPGEGINYLTERSYIEGDMVTEPANDPITPMSGGNVLVRPEGQWHREGVLENEPGTGEAR